MKKFRLLGMALVATLMLGACDSAPASSVLPYQVIAYPMGTFINLQIFDEGKEPVLELALDRITELEALFTVNEGELLEYSEVERINRYAGVEPVAVSDITFFLVGEAVEFSRYSGGLFNATIGALTDLWQIGFEGAHRPTNEEIEAVLPLLDYNNVVLDSANQTVYLEAGMRFDLGGIAKGFIADEVQRVFAENGVENAIIDLGGDLFVMGHNLRGNPWNVGVQNPFAGRGTGQSVLAFSASDRSIVTSGVYERFLDYEGTRYHHIFNSETGFPFDNDVAGVTIVASSAIEGEKYTKLAFGLGVEAGLAAIEAVDGIEAIFINFDKEIFTTSGLRGELRNVDSSFTVVE